MAAQPAGNNFLALDVGSVRIGVAVASGAARLAHPLLTIANNEHVWEMLESLLHQELIGVVVLGLPRNLSGDDTPQTGYVRTFGTAVQARFDLPVYFQDEALTSRKAEEELIARGKHYTKADIDALAAAYILEDFLHQRNSHA